MVEFALVLPIMLILLFGILDLARVYTTMMGVESAAREAADYGTTLGAGKWQDGLPRADTEAAMQHRACVAARNLTDYTDPDGDPANWLHQPGLHVLHDVDRRRDLRPVRCDGRVRDPDAADALLA